jgi:hypothetical protein
MAINITKQNVEKIMNDATDAACSELNTHIEDYLKQRAKK